MIVTGIAGDICVLFTANDAYMRDLKVLVPPDCTASKDPEENRRVLTLMQRVLKADIKPSLEIGFTNDKKLPSSRDRDVGIQRAKNHLSHDHFKP